MSLYVRLVASFVALGAGCAAAVIVIDQLRRIFA